MSEYIIFIGLLGGLFALSALKTIIRAMQLDELTQGKFVKIDDMFFYECVCIAQIVSWICFMFWLMNKPGG